MTFDHYCYLTELVTALKANDPAAYFTYENMTDEEDIREIKKQLLIHKRLIDSFIQLHEDQTL